jgi:hypothetical protein
MRLLASFVLSLPLLAQHPGWTSEREYANVQVTFEYKLAQWAEAAFVLRTPSIGRPVQQGVAVFLAHDFHRRPGLYTTGALAGRQAPLQLLPPSFDQWHKLDITLNGNHLTVLQDGELLQRATLPHQLLLPGHLHFADLLHQYEVRNFSVRELPDTTTFLKQWKPWRLRDGGSWQTGPDWATGADGHGIQYAAPLLSNFLFAAEIKSSTNANGGIFLRGHPVKDRHRGFEVQIYSPLDSVFPTGSIYGIERSRIASSTAGRWFYLQILVIGRECRVWVDGVEVAHTTQLPEIPTLGQIGLQIHMDKAQIEWRRLRALNL